MTARASCSGLLAAVAVVASTPALRGMQAPTFRAGVAVVRVNVLATDRGRPLAGLTGDDFEVRDNGVLQQVEATYGESEPLDVLFAFDRSQSMAGETLGRLGDAARAVLDQLGPDDRAGLVTFNQTFALEAPMATDRTRIRAALAEIEPGGSTSLRDTLYAALTLLAAGGSRVLLLVFTDGIDSTSWLPDRTIVEMARESEAVGYAVPFVRPEERLLEDVADATGGRVVLADSDDRLRRVFLDVLREMRSRHVLTFTPTGAEPGWHTLSVRLKKGEGRVTARPGYAVR